MENSVLLLELLVLSFVLSDLALAYRGAFTGSMGWYWGEEEEEEEEEEE